VRVWGRGLGGGWGEVEEASLALCLQFNNQKQPKLRHNAVANGVSEEVQLEMSKADVPEDVAEGYSLEFVWKSTTFDRMRGAIKLFRGYAASISGAHGCCMVAWAHESMHDDGMRMEHSQIACKHKRTILVSSFAPPPPQRLPVPHPARPRAAARRVQARAAKGRRPRRARPAGAQPLAAGRGPRGALGAAVADPGAPWDRQDGHVGGDRVPPCSLNRRPGARRGAVERGGRPARRKGGRDGAARRARVRARARGRGGPGGAPDAALPGIVLFCMCVCLQCCFGKSCTC
jgi:hypothetical protein